MKNIQNTKLLMIKPEKIKKGMFLIEDYNSKKTLNAIKEEVEKNPSITEKEFKILMLDYAKIIKTLILLFEPCPVCNEKEDDCPECNEFIEHLENYKKHGYKH